MVMLNKNSRGKNSSKGLNSLRITVQNLGIRLIIIIRRRVNISLLTAQNRTVVMIVIVMLVSLQLPVKFL